MHRSPEIRLHDLPHARFGNGFSDAEGVDACVVYDDIDAAEVLDCGVESGIYGCGGVDVESEFEDVGVVSIEVREGGCVAGGSDEAMVLGGDVAGDGGADAGGAACYWDEVLGRFGWVS